MALSYAQVKEAFSRLRGQSGAGNMDKETKVFLAEELAKVSLTVYHANQIVETWLTRDRFMPTPSDLRALAEECPTHPPTVDRKEFCPLCRGEGRESFWALVTTERWHDSGRIKARITERIPPIPGREEWYLIERPAVEATVDGINQRVCMMSDFCPCRYGQHIKQLTLIEKAKAADKRAS